LQQAGTSIIVERQEVVLVLHDEIQIAGQIGAPVPVLELNGIVGMKPVSTHQVPMTAGDGQPQRQGIDVAFEAELVIYLHRITFPGF
jgi:hypothetical protein